jgi:glucose-6-phosphate 1-dehydrogenase
MLNLGRGVAERRSASATALTRVRHRSWLRVIVEKPFGKDLESSETLAAELARWYLEEQVSGT